MLALRRLLLAVAFVLSLPLVTRGTDIPVNSPGPVFKLSSLVWGNSSPQGFNNNFYFVPQNVNESVCVFVYNNNPTSAHPFTASIIVTGDPSNVTPSDGTWQAANSGNFTIAVSPSSSQGFGATVNGVAKFSISFSASTSLAGAPDTANVIITQNPGGPCFSGAAFASGIPNTTTAFTPLQSISDGLSQGFTVSDVTVNPTAAQYVATLNNPSTTKALYLDRVILSSTTAVQLELFGITSSGTCTPSNPAQIKVGALASTSTTSGQNCTVVPTTGGLGMLVQVGASNPVVIDGKGMIAIAGANNGFGIQSTAVTGTVDVVWVWYEK